MRKGRRRPIDQLIGPDRPSYFSRSPTLHAAASSDRNLRKRNGRLLISSSDLISSSAVIQKLPVPPKRPTSGSPPLSELATTPTSSSNPLTRCHAPRRPRAPLPRRLVPLPPLPFYPTNPSLIGHAFCPLRRFLFACRSSSSLSLSFSCS